MFECQSKNGAEGQNLNGKKRPTWKLVAIVGGGSVLLGVIIFVIVWVSKRLGERPGGYETPVYHERNVEVEDSGSWANEIIDIDPSLPFEVQLPAKFLLPNTLEFMDDADKVAENAFEDKKVFLDSLNEQRKAYKKKYPYSSSYANGMDSLVESRLREKFIKKVMKGNMEDIKSGLETYHWAIKQTNVPAEIPADIKDIKDVEIYRIVRKCLAERVLAEEDKLKLQNILQHPSLAITMTLKSSAYLGRKLEDSTVDEAFATVKKYFTGNAKLKSKFDSHACSVQYFNIYEIFERMDMSRKGMAENFPDALRVMTKLPSELKDEKLVRTDAKESLQTLLENQNIPSLELLKSVKSDEIPSIETIEAALTVLPKDDSLFMAKFARQLTSYVKEVGYKQAEREPANQDWIESLVSYCIKSLMARYVDLVVKTPQDDRITSLSEWKTYINDPYSIANVASLYKSITNLGMDTFHLSDYVDLTTHVKFYKDSDEGTNFCMNSRHLKDLFQYNLPNSYPYNVMREGLFDPNNINCSKAIEHFLAKPKSELSSLDLHFSPSLKTYLSYLREPEKWTKLK